MPFKRPLRSYTCDDGSLSPSDRPSSSRRIHSSSPRNIEEEKPLLIYILPAKIHPEAMSELIMLVEDYKIERVTMGHQGRGVISELNLQLTGDAEKANIVVTAIRMRQRLERHIDSSIAKTKAIVTPSWLRDSLTSGQPLPYRNYAAVHDLEDETLRHCPDAGQDTSSSSSLRSRSQEKENSWRTEPDEPIEVTEVELLSHKARYSCLRPSPLVCPNQSLVEEINIIRRSRHLEGEERSMLSYSRAISVIKAYPRIITQRDLHDLHELPFLGEKLYSMIQEFVKTGRIAEAQTILADSRFQSLSAFDTIYGIGPHTARRLYDLGLRTLEELEQYYEVIPGVSDEETISLLEESTNTEAAVEKTIKIGLALRHDLSHTISRPEVEEINRTVMQELSHIQKGCKSVIAGGYRRGKLQSNDVDIVITHADWKLGSQKVKGLCKKLVQRLHEQGLVTHVMHISGFHEHNALRTHHWDSLEKALTVFAWPHNSSWPRVHRRVDLIFAAPEVFWTAVVGASMGRQGGLAFQKQSSRRIDKGPIAAYIVGLQSQQVIK
ncbi:hypothetical protein AZE42_05230 [Rhizopogon vesiculosus]|uniref:DNA-directed DNA polymerase n=1 Tax=Rhizopogon vesiculosus TaxID=180088 RepID=A0A1J8QB20_9AGAM|nr:hypothetical protein AZE42_05230 [Rhizopogon vesiculosus]